ncbi:MAG: hypothetical protein MZU97_08705 [Bacillus subtilis]|nr:hypothetical protein [Bacillus subtilis]
MNALASFKHVLKQRNELLKSFALTKKYDELFLDVLDNQFEAAAAQIVAKRAAFLREVALLADAAFAVLTGRENELSLVYQPSLDSDYKTALQGRLKSDLNQGATGLGRAPRRLRHPASGSKRQGLRQPGRATALCARADPCDGRLPRSKHQRDAGIAFG